MLLHFGEMWFTKCHNLFWFHLPVHDNCQQSVIFFYNIMDIGDVKMQKSWT